MLLAVTPRFLVVAFFVVVFALSLTVAFSTFAVLFAVFVGFRELSFSLSQGLPDAGFRLC